MKKVLVLSLALILLLGIMSHGTSSYFSDTETSAGNTFTAWVEEVVCACEKFNVSDFSGNDRRIFTYDVSDSSASFIGFFDLDADNGHPSGVASFADSIYVLDQSDKQVYKYDCCGTLLGVSRELLPSGGGSIANPVGLAIYGDEMWVVSANDKKIYGYPLSAAYPYSDTPLTPTTEIPLVPNNTGASGLAVDSNYLYVLDDAPGSKANLIYEYPRGGGGTVIVSGELMTDTTTNVSLEDPRGAMVDGDYIWVVDTGTEWAYKYSLATLFSGASKINSVDDFELHADNDDASGV